jgi:hypothetical protein
VASFFQVFELKLCIKIIYLPLSKSFMLMSSSVDPISCLWLCVLFQRIFNDAYFSTPWVIQNGRARLLRMINWEDVERKKSRYVCLRTSKVPRNVSVNMISPTNQVSTQAFLSTKFQCSSLDIDFFVFVSMRIGICRNNYVSCSDHQ